MPIPIDGYFHMNPLLQYVSIIILLRLYSSTSNLIIKLKIKGRLKCDIIFPLAPGAFYSINFKNP